MNSLFGCPEIRARYAEWPMMEVTTRYSISVSGGHAEHQLIITNYRVSRRQIAAACLELHPIRRAREGRSKES